MDMARQAWAKSLGRRGPSPSAIICVRATEACPVGRIWWSCICNFAPVGSDIVWCTPDRQPNLFEIAWYHAYHAPNKSVSIFNNGSTRMCVLVLTEARLESDWMSCESVCSNFFLICWAYQSFSSWLPSTCSYSIELIFHNTNRLNTFKLINESDHIFFLETSKWALRADPYPIGTLRRVECPLLTTHSNTVSKKLRPCIAIASHDIFKRFLLFGLWLDS